MSNAVTALNGAKYSGLIDIADAGLMGMITLRGDLASAAMAKVVKSITGAKMPKPRGVETAGKGSVAWMSPDELLIMVDYPAADAAEAKITDALSGQHHLAVNVSDARAVFDLTGDHLRDVLAKGSPTNLNPDALPIGEVRRTRLGQLAVAFWFTDESAAKLVCFRSVGDHVFKWLANAAQNGSSPNFHSDMR
ncbi:sarcosine oxidase subunit gamma [Amylibacter ulvae]|uniref:Sarcosine oxidase subunit gamma n=1 Tax=Paramylibacter ulvae TaxID=1651968 RepID=A0ABQ3D1N5_9RHOB|nr:sarcosine oxidase subunit gamma family protein [Amylibacter ulvae]GHA53175.1 sarcosine oxidase subunit gamma [Amylibacter ulvae]